MRYLQSVEVEIGNSTVDVECYAGGDWRIYHQESKPRASGIGRERKRLHGVERWIMRDRKRADDFVEEIHYQLTR